MTTGLAALLVLLAATGSEDPALRRALLVGVSAYPNLGESEQLAGCENDVALMRATLIERFGFDDAEIITLVGERATGEAIRDRLDSVAAEVAALPANKRAEVVFHFSGHGSQLVDQPGEGRDEPDGMDETLVPSDATRQGGPQDIRDDELYAFATDVCRDGNSRLWMILDCCHSGTGTRGVLPGAITRYRQLARSVPGPEADARTEAPIQPRRLPAGAVALYACRDRELEPEYVEAGQSYGLLTRFLAQVIGETEDLTTLSYAMLSDSIRTHYRQDRRLATATPSPAIEASAELLSAPLLGASGRPRRPYFPITTEDRTMRVRAGLFHGLSADSIAEVYVRPSEIVFHTETPNEQTGESIGFVRLTEVAGGESLAEFVTLRNGRARPTRPPRGFAGGYIIVRRRGDVPLQTRLYVADETLRPRVAEVVAEATAGEQAAWVTITTDPTAADLLIRRDGDRVAVFPTVVARAVPQSDNPLSGGWGPISLDETFPTQLAGLLKTVARGRNLVRLGAIQPSDASQRLDVSVELLQVADDAPDDAPDDEAEPWPSDSAAGERPAGPRPMRTGDRFRIRVRNQAVTGGPIYVSVLIIDGNLGISQVLPYQSGDEVFGTAAARLHPGESRDEGPFQCNRDVEDLGTWHAVVFATAEPNRFYQLAQKALPRVRSNETPSEIGSYLLEGVDFRTRGRRASLEAPWGTALTSWTVVP